MAFIPPILNVPNGNIFNVDVKNLSAETLRQLGGSSSLPILTYPQGLGGSNDQSSDLPFVLFAPYTRTGASAFNNGVGYKAVLDQLPAPKFAVALPIPNSALKTTYGVGYNTFDMGIGGDILSGLNGAISKYTTEHPELGGLGFNNRVENAVIKSTQTINEATTKSAYLGIQSFASLANITGTDFKSIFQKSMGVVPNPFTETIFNNVKIRTHDFAYTFLPKSYDESKAIDNIIQIFKFYMLPASAPLTLNGAKLNDVENGSFFSFPYEFQITYSVADTTFRLLPSVLENMSVDYGGDGTPSFFFSQDNTNKRYPTRINVSMTFKEIMFLTRDRIAVDAGISPDITTELGTNKFTRFRF